MSLRNPNICPPEGAKQIKQLWSRIGEAISHVGRDTWATGFAYPFKVRKRSFCCCVWKSNLITNDIQLLPNFGGAHRETIIAHNSSPILKLIEQKQFGQKFVQEKTWTTPFFPNYTNLEHYDHMAALFRLP